jgi:UDP-glucose 4-epimerase
MALAKNLPDYYSIPPDLRDLNYGKFIDHGEVTISDAQDYNSNNTERLDVDGMKKLLLKLPFIRELMNGSYISPLE